MKLSVIAKAVMTLLSVAVAQGSLAQGASTDAGAENAGAVESIVIQGAFFNTGAQSAMKLDAPILDTPFSVSSYSDSFMKAIETSAIADMYNYMVGIKKAGNTGYDVVVRGMKAGANDRNSILIDGLPGLAGRYNSPPTIGVEHMELVKGPMSVLYGQAQPGGFINLISKKPKATRSTEVDLKAMGFIGHGLSPSDANGYEVSVDTTGPIDEKKHWLYRFIAQVANRDGFRNSTYDQPSYVAPSLTWNIDDTTLLTAIMEHRRSKTSYDQGMVAPNNQLERLADIRTRYHEPSDYQKEIGKSLSLQFEHTFANDIKWSAATRSSRGTDQAYAYDVVSSIAPFTSVQRRARAQVNLRQYDFFDTSLAIPFKTGSVGHKVLIGLNGGRETADFDRHQFFNGVCATGSSPASGQCLNIDLYNPVYGVATPLNQLPAFTGGITNTNAQHRLTTSRSQGAYITDLLTLGEKWKASLGLRSARDSQSFQELRVVGSNGQLPGIPSKVSNKVLPLAGLLYQPTKDYTVYGSYSTSYVPAPASSQDVNGANPFTPESSKQIEFGVKGENLLNGRLTGTLGVFRINKTNALSTYSGIANGCPAAIPTCTRQVGRERSEGVELELNARPLDNWQLSAGYAYTDAKIVGSSPDLAPYQLGFRLTNVARNSANVWSRYDWTDGPMKGLGLGVGLNYTGARNGPLPAVAATPTAPNTFVLPAYTLADLGIYYTYDRYAFTLKFGNIFDKVYYESSGLMGNINVSPGAPRNATLSMRMHF